VSSDGLAFQTRRRSTGAMLACLLAATLVMGAGWGIRGSFGHSRGAMMPGVMLGLVLAACAGRPDWWRRGPIIGLLAGIGWAFGGAASYGKLIGYTFEPQFSTSLYGYTALLVVGALYGGVGCGLLGLAMTQSRSFLERALWPLVILYGSWMLLSWSGVTEWSLELFAKDPERPEETGWLFDTLWICAAASLLLGGLMLAVPRWRPVAALVVCMAAGWWLAMAMIPGAIGFRINPSRNDSWAGVLGIQLGLIAYLIATRNRASLMLVGYGLLSGGIGFPLGQLLQVLGRQKWGPMASVPFLAELDHWTLMEQTFGYCMGLGAALGVLRLVRGGLRPAVEDVCGGWLNTFAVWIMLGLLLALNLPTNYRNWVRFELLKPETMGLPSGELLTWVVLFCLLLLGWVLVAQKLGKVDLLPSSAKGRQQLLTLVMLVAVPTIFFLLPSLKLPTSIMFVVALGIGGLCVLHAGDTETPSASAPNFDAACWRLGWRHVALWVIVPALLCGLAFVSASLTG
jgi:hypothetical protein